ncbi:MAG: c-type cytochrome [Candidatus Nitricoxidivorans perseverans]|uniref:C-type cytochrome n=1 Tax=Candidatus Nitricoxidivorans perseverans TaxID=2975601 RepID=A0AA49FJH1_9PROT|nr:MAG: c-type cytochrome [Candidatus Nitricoxidivorans perseverans]
MAPQQKTRISWIWLPLFLLAGTPAGAQSPERLKSVLADPHARAAAVEAGRKASSFCANCHGADGNSKTPEVPNLAGQNPIYLLEQVRKFASGARRDQWMEPAIKLLNDTERLNIVAYYASMEVAPARSTRPSDAGRELFSKRCSACHGGEARGGERFPRLAGQQAVYLVRSLTRYRDRTGQRMEPEMLAMTAALRDKDIRDLSDYLSALR